MKAKFGFGSLRVDNIHTVFTCKIIVTNPVTPPEFAHSGIRVTHSKERFHKRSESWLPADVYVIRYCTMDYAEKTEMQKLIGDYLKNHAIAKLEQKWQWLETPEDALQQAIELAGDALPPDWAMSL